MIVTILKPNDVMHGSSPFDPDYLRIFRTRVLGKIIKINGTKCNLNFIDMSEVDSLSGLFNSKLAHITKFNGDISEWNVSNVGIMDYLFANSSFNGDLSKWDVSKVFRMEGTFRRSRFNNPSINKWDVSNVVNMYEMFKGNKYFNQDISGWNTKSLVNISGMFKETIFLQDISKWNVGSVKCVNDVYKDSKLGNEENSPLRAKI